MTIGLTHYLVVGAILFTAGVVCMAMKRNALGVLMGIELVLNGANVNFVAFASPYLQGEGARGLGIDGQVIACTPEYFGMNRLKIARGRALSELDMQTYANVVVLAHEAAERLFPIEDPLDRAVQIGTEFYVVVGIAAERSAAAAIGGSLDARQYDRDVYIPLSTFRARIGDLPRRGMRTVG